MKFFKKHTINSINKKIKLRTWVALGVIGVLLPIVIFGVYKISAAPNPPIAYWALDEGSDNTCSGGSNDACDGTTNANDLAKTNGTWQSDQLCIAGKCLYLDGNGDYLSRADDADFDFAAADSFAITGWFRHGEISTNPDYIVGKHGATGTDGGYKVWMDSDGDIYCGIDDDDTFDPDAAANTTNSNYDDNKWHHFECVKNGTTSLTLYIDGNQVNQNTSINTVGTLANSDTLYVGNHDTGTDGWGGFLDEIKIFRVNRAASDVKTDAVKGATAGGAAAVFGAQDTSFLNHGLVGYWELNETSGNATDKSGNNTTLTNNSITPYTSAKFGNGAELDGATDFLDAADSATLSVTGSLTLSAWIEPDDITGTENIIAKWDGANESYRLTKEAANIRMYIDADANYQATTGNPLTANTKTHVAGVYDATSQTVKIYINGSEATSATTGTIPSSIGDDAGDLHIGAEDSTTATANFFAGHIDEARIYNRALSSGEIRSLYNWVPGPTGHWKFDENTGTSAFDSSGGGNTATITDAATITGGWTTGKYGGTYNMRGNEDGDLIDISDIALGTRNTISFWVNFYDLGGGAGANDAVFGGNTSDPADGYMVYADGTNIYSRQALASGVSVAAAFTNNTWYHISVVRDGTSITFYRNGQQLGTTQTYSSNNAFTVRSLTNFATGITSFSFEGKIDDIRIYSYPRTFQQVIEDMNGGHPAGGSPIGTQHRYYKFDETYGQVVNDTVGNDSGELAGSATSQTEDPTWKTSPSCKINGCLDFEATASEYVGSIGSLALNASSFTVSAWTKRESSSADMDIIFSGSSADNNGLRFGFTSTNVFRCGFFNNDLDTTTTHTDTDWHHWACTYNASTNLRQIYKDGQVVASGTASADFGGTNTTWIGSNINGTSNFFDGLIDEVQVYATDLTTEQVGIVMNTGSTASMGVLGTTEESTIPTGAGNPPKSWLTLDENTGTTANDRSGNNNNGTIYDSRPFYPGKLGSAIYFDGSNVKIGQSSDSHILLPTDAFLAFTDITVEFWFKADDRAAGADWQNMFGWITFGGVDTGKTFEIAYKETTNQVAFWTDWDGLGNCATEIDAVTPALPSGTEKQWHHFAFAMNSSGNNIYIDGVKQPLVYTTGSATTNCNLTLLTDGVGDTQYYSIGCWYIDTTDYCFETEMYEGFIDEFKLYDYARSSDQVAYDYNRGRPTAWWKLDECSGTTIYDAGPHGSLGTLTLGASPASGTCTTSGAWFNGATGKFNSGMDFDGTDDYIDMDDGQFLEASDSAGLKNDMTISGWFNRDTATSDDTIVAKRNGQAAADTGYIVYLDDSTDKLTFEISDGTDEYEVASSTTFTSTGWNHFALIWDEDSATNTTLYINGVANSPGKTGTIGNIGDASNNVDFRLGSESDGGEPMDGKLDDIRFYRYALSAAQVRTLFNDDATSFFGPATGSP